MINKTIAIKAFAVFIQITEADLEKRAKIKLALEKLSVAPSVRKYGRSESSFN